MRVPRERVKRGLYTGEREEPVGATAEHLLPILKIVISI